ncbi:hypothetical protein COU78_04145 [Candidatus Peregrinibacteria bacterium CG10_big_fil_rev_8_21_14_0_10_49_24]|nr:MAG: hypothetical protein COV83_00675 [Candidatus Peregrinibacteria bacterium CG11_big_fil_rev_8_21_14_0_20_49_14]PIR50860.1 MAG: hypothetical protein COU78_04145 [Candidatus Peregrinibacteria bacterium CG10_big_fil_rev_8_21_14_0_10_49_24]PJA67137.1 MAG: hypothetical protein CO157_06075 [Candidatus Peregrinibacteria bacterium CG_4_9_14_3_um_filter_49_12]
MAQREVSIAVCGMVVGTMLGAGTIIFGRDVTASLFTGADDQFVSYRQGFIMQDDFRRRSIIDEDRRTRPQAHILEDAVAPTRTEDTETKPSISDAEGCADKVRIAEDLRADIVPLIPLRGVDRLVRRSIHAAFDAYIADCMIDYKGYEPEAGVDFEIKKAPSSLQQDADYCLQFSGSRRSRCLVEQRSGDR